MAKTKSYVAKINLPGVSAGTAFEADPDNPKVKRYVDAGLVDEVKGKAAAAESAPAP